MPRARFHSPRVLALAASFVATCAGVALADVLACDSEGELHLVDVSDGSARGLGPVGVTQPDGWVRWVILTDLAFTADGTVYGVSFTDLYVVDPNDPARSRHVGPLGTGGVNALAIAADGRLLAAANGGGLFEVDPWTGATTHLADWPQGGSSGDLAIVAGEPYATIVPFHSPEKGDLLAHVDLATGAATTIGAIIDDAGRPCCDVYGLAVERGVLYGLDSTGRLLEIDPATAHAREIGRAGPSYWGATDFDITF